MSVIKFDLLFFVPATDNFLGKWIGCCIEQPKLQSIHNVIEIEKTYFVRGFSKVFISFIPQKISCLRVVVPIEGSLAPRDPRESIIQFLFLFPVQDQIEQIIAL